MEDQKQVTNEESRPGKALRGSESAATPNSKGTHKTLELATLLSVVTVVAILYLARVILIPMALAVLLAFLLAPLVLRLRRIGLGRAPAVTIVVISSLFLIFVITASVTTQLTELAQRLPEYQQNVKDKLESVRRSGGGLVTRAFQLVRNINEQLLPPTQGATEPLPGGEKPVPVEIRRVPFNPIEAMQQVLGSVLNIALIASVVVVFVIFILLQKEDLRDRLLRLAGESRLHLATQVLDDAALRVSRYLVAQLVINVSFGILAGIGLYFIKVPDPFLWGALAALLRYIPYLGIWLAAALPIAVVFAVDPGWIKIPAIIALYFCIDLLMYNVAEPILYGTSTGISPMAILVAAVFWTWLWGPVGLLLSTPLTVCVVVIGRYVPNFEFLSVLLSDEQVLPAHMKFYQRLLALDVEEATEIAEQFLKGHPLEEVYDLVIIPALSMAEAERHRGQLDDLRQKFIFQSTRMLVEDLAERAGEIMQEGTKDGTDKIPTTAKVSTDAGAQVLCIPARDEADAISALMLAQLLRRNGIAARELPFGTLNGDYREEIDRHRPRVACVTSIPPFGFVAVRHVCRRLRSQVRETRIVAAVLTEQSAEMLKKKPHAVDADESASSLQQAVSAAKALLACSDDAARKVAGAGKSAIITMMNPGNRGEAE
jgi:predicted PurR-regulated permease PerM